MNTHRIVHKRASNIKMVRVIHVNHGGSNVRYVSSRVRFTGNVDLELGDAEDLLKVLEEANKVCSCFFFCSGRHLALTESQSNRIFDPKHVGEVRPAIRVLKCIVHSPGPDESTFKMLASSPKVGQEATDHSLVGNPRASCIQGRH